METKLPIDLRRIMVPDARGFHGAAIPFQDKYICIYHNSERHRLASCFLEMDSEFNFKVIEGTRTEDLGISQYIDPRLVLCEGKYFLSLSFNAIPEKICLFALNVADKITINKNVSIFRGIKGFDNYNAGSREKNWTPWSHDGKLLYTYSLNPHRILEVDLNGTNSATLIAETSWKSDLWWDTEQWVAPKYRLNTPPLLLPDGTYLSMFHTMRMATPTNPNRRRRHTSLMSYWTGFFQFESIFPFRVLAISRAPFVSPDFSLPAGWPFHPPPSGGNPFYPFSMMLVDGKIIMVGGSNEIAIAHCSIPLDKILESLSPVETINHKPNAMNTILNDTQREKHKEDIATLFLHCPEMMGRKIPRANIQQGFMLSKVRELSQTSSEILCVGSFEDTACESLIKMGYGITAIDPAINIDLDGFYKKSDGKQYDVVFSTSVIEHVPNDELFIDQICKLLKPGGYAVLTCDFNDGYGKNGITHPGGDYRLYTKNDLLVRFDKILKENGCEIYGDVDYDHAPDFDFGGCRYSFASYVFKKK